LTKPAGNLDDDNARKITDLLSRACHERGKRLIFLTLRPEDRVIGMKCGTDS
jgi:predicted ABC-type transport system involved in lysophospholipase L1 biosynthesis ATPase subunit